MEREDHITITVLSDRLPRLLLCWQKLIVQLVLIAFGVVFVWSAWLNVLNSWEFYAPSMTWFRMSYLYLVLVFSGILTLFYILLNVLRTLFPGRFGAPREGTAG
jgi:TRAP-type C4-dicarboxylate transport system permease small subunit